MIVVGGIMSGGLLAVFILWWNGFIFGTIIIKSIVLGIPPHILLLETVIHGPLEIFAFCWLGMLGLRSAKITYIFFKDGSISTVILPKLLEIMVPILLLVTAAFLEVWAMAYLGI